MAQQQKKWFSFDPTIHAGHIVIVSSVLCSFIGSFYLNKADIDYLKSENERRRTEIKEMRQYSHTSFEKLRDEMNGWFMVLNDKLDRKADKP